MDKPTLDKMKTAEQYCDENDKSTAFLIEYIQDFAGVNFDTAMNFLQGKYKTNEK